MQRSTALIVFGALAFGGGAPSAAAGNSSSGGGEFITTENNPWFIGETPVSYCVEADHAAFSAGDAQIDAAVQEALTTWASTVQALAPIPTGAIGGQPRSLSTSFVRSPCDASTELRFVFGVHTPEIDELLKQFARYTISFAKQRAFDEATGRAKGVVWVAGDRGASAYMGPHAPGEYWSMGATLYNVLLHELGHVYGLGHSNTGAMNANVPEWSVLGASSTRYAIEDKLMQQWRRTRHDVCGWLDHLGSPADAAFIDRLFGVPDREPARACLHVEASARLRLTVEAGGRVLGAWVLDETGTWPRITTTLDAIVGRYQKSPTSSNDEFPWPEYHAFVPSGSEDVLLHGRIGDQVVRMVVETLDDRVHVIVTGSVDEPPHPFEIAFPLVADRRLDRRLRKAK
jgi:hypothetical protein